MASQRVNPSLSAVVKIRPIPEGTSVGKMSVQRVNPVLSAVQNAKFIPEGTSVTVTTVEIDRPPRRCANCSINHDKNCKIRKCRQNHFWCNHV